MSLGFLVWWGRASLDQRGIDRGASSPTKSCLVELDRDAVQRYRALERLGRERHQSPLIGIAEHKKIARDRIPEQASGEASRVEKLGVTRSRRLGDAALQVSAGENEIRVTREIPSDGLVAVDDRAAVSRLQLR